MTKRFIYIASAALFFAACDDDFVAVEPVAPIQPAPEEEVIPETGDADFSRFVAVGNSLTAGYSDNALFIDGQNTSFPSTLASQFAKAYGEDYIFTQPMMADNLGGMTYGGQPISGNRLYLDFSSGSPTPTPKSGQGSTEVTNRLTGSFNNMGVPGAKSYHLLAEGYGAMAGVPSGSANPYFARMASSDAASVAGDAMAQNPTFFSLWIGNNDILGYATSGGSGVDQTGNLDPTTYGGNDITDPNVFAQVYQGLLATMTSAGAKGIVANIPDVTTIPYFTTVPYNPLSPEALDGQVALLNQVYGALNNVYLYLASQGMDTAGRSVVWSDQMANPVVIIDETLMDLSAQITGVLSASPEFSAFVQSLGLPAEAVPTVAALMGSTYGQSRPATAEDLMVFTSSTVIGTVNTDRVAELMMAGLSQELAGTFSVEGVTLPMEDKWVLTSIETEEVRVAQTAYNNTIQGLAQQFGLAYFDAEAALEQLANGGITMNGITTTSTYATGGAFSLDGVHPSPRGYAIISNLMLEQINMTYGSSFGMVNIIDFKGVYLD